MSKKLRELQKKKADAAKAKVESLQAATAILDKVSAEGRDMTEAEQQDFTNHKAAATAKGNEIDQAQAAIDLEQELINAQVAAGSVVVIAGNGSEQLVDRADADRTCGFASKGDFFKAVRQAASSASTGAPIDPRLNRQAAVPGMANNESTGTDGGFAVPPQFSQEIWQLSLQEGSLLPFTANTEVTSNSMVFPKDETTPWGGAGVQAYWRGENQGANASKFAMGIDSLRLKELMVLVPVTNELLDDAPALGSYMTPLAADRIQWKANEAILFGTGGAQPLGCMSSNALVVVAKENGQATNTILQPNISKMRSRLVTGNLKNAIWVGNPDILPALEGLVVGNIPIFLPPSTGLREAYDGTLNGRPLVLSEHAAAFSKQSDLSLIALNGYRTITKAGGIETATSMHIYFDANATAFRFIFRMDGQPIISAAIQPPKSQNTRSYFVTLGAR